MKITITVNVDGNSLEREYIDKYFESEELWGGRIVDMLDTIKTSKEERF